MGFKKITDIGKKVLVSGQIATNVATVPVTKDLTPTLTKQVAKYSKDVRLPETRREIERQIKKDMRPVAALDKRSSKRLRKS
ncbi:hypothetical protein D0Z08_31200 [Nocardioides immobilis]|uniref:Uncharacterized protein n=1 Tax=Nocardioides immobilis TaxID=2049295 RepID=A0A417XSD7_9ACTN|nr:hypothetical protein [Nocardioides immobilis]RHW22778.1 hypothetical protein D0Z08_31200 [Nocardioides immobilis]